MAPTALNKNGSQWSKPGPKTSPSTDTAPPTGKYEQHQLGTIWKSVPKKDALSLAEKLQLLKSLSPISDTLCKEAHEGLSTTYITDFSSFVTNPKNTATAMEIDGHSAVLVSDSEPEVLDSDLDSDDSHLQSSQGLMMVIGATQSDNAHSWISINE